jgi:salicylate hydroxylase
MATPRAAVVGAGIAGVTMTHALRGVGFEVELFEQSDKARSTGYQLNVLPNGVFALEKLGLLEAVRTSRCGATMQSAPIFDGRSGRVLRQIRTVYGAHGEYAAMSFYRGGLHQVLLDSMRGPGPHCRRAFQSFSEDAAGRVIVEFSDGRTESFNLLVGADGVHSKVRLQLFPEGPRFVPRLASLLFAARIDLDGTSEAEELFADQARRGEFSQFIAPGTAVILSHAGRGQFGIIIAVPNLSEARTVATPAQAKEIARRLVRDVRDPRVRHAIDVCFWEEGNPLVWVVGDIEPLRSFSRGAVALCGDAAHPMIPVVAQGANQSFEDAWRLALHLREVVTSGSVSGIPAALERYSRERVPHVARIQKEARRRTLPLLITGSRFSCRLYT